MDKHRKIIGNIYFGLGVILLVLLALTWRNNSAGEEEIESSFYQSFFIATIPFLAAGISLLGNFRWAHWVCLPISILFIFSFPIGTIIGGYYLWFFRKLSKSAA